MGFCLCGFLLVLLDLFPPAGLQSITGPEENRAEPPDFMLSIYRTFSSAERLGLNSSQAADTIISFVDAGQGMCTSMSVHVSCFLLFCILLPTEMMEEDMLVLLGQYWVSTGHEDISEEGPTMF